MPDLPRSVHRSPLKLFDPAYHTAAGTAARWPDQSPPSFDYSDPVYQAARKKALARANGPCPSCRRCGVGPARSALAAPPRSLRASGGVGRREASPRPPRRARRPQRPHLLGRFVARDAERLAVVELVADRTTRVVRDRMGGRRLRGRQPMPTGARRHPPPLSFNLDTGLYLVPDEFHGDWNYQLVPR